MLTDCDSQLTCWNIGRQQVTVDFEGGRIVSDAGLLAVRDFERRLGIVAGLAQRFPDPRAPRFIQHSAKEILTQHVYQFLAGYFDCNDAKTLRHDPLFLTLADLAPSQPAPADESEVPALSSGSTLARFQYAYTRREAQLPIDERLVLFEQRSAQLDRIQLINEYLIDLFLRTRQQRPRFVIVDIDPTDDPTHGQQVLTFYHGYYEQHQYFPLLLFDGVTGFPLGAWLRPGAVHAACGVVGSLDLVVKKLRAAWPDVTIVVRGDTGEAVPEVARAEVSTLRATLFKVGASVETSVRRVWFHFSSTWPYRDLFVRVVAALRDFVRRLESRALQVLAPPATEPMAIATG